MSDCSQVLSHKNRLKAAAKELSFDELLKLQENVAEIISKREAAEAEARAAAAEKEKALEEARAFLESRGLSFEDVYGSAEMETSTKSNKRGPVPAKYRLVENGQTVCEWSGRGRTPKPIQAFLDQGNSIDALLIK